MAKSKAVVVGAGSISGAWFPPLIKEKVDIVGVVDLSLDNAQGRIKEFGLDCKASTDLAATLKATSPDFIVDCTIPEAHCAVTCAALKAGCHVLGEKPMANSLTEARRMVKAAEKADKLYMVSQSRRWDVNHDIARRTLAANRIGEVTMANCDFFMAIHFGGFRDTMPSPLILDMAIHHFDLLRFFTGKDAVSVYAHEFNPAGSWYAGDVAASCIFEMSDGMMFTYRGCWCAEGCHTSWNGNWRLTGTKGTMLVEDDKAPFGEVVTGVKSGFTRPLKPLKTVSSPLKQTTMHGALREMLAYLRTGKMPQTPCQDNIKSLAMVFAAMQSARAGKRVPVRAM